MITFTSTSHSEKPRVWLLVFLLAVLSIPGYAQRSSAYSLRKSEAQRVEETAEFHHQLGVAYHLRRCLDDASREYTRALELDPPRELTEDDWRLARRFAPRVYVTASEFFTLKDFSGQGRAYFSEDYDFDPAAIEKNLNKFPDLRTWLPELADRFEDMGEPDSPAEMREMVKDMGRAMDDDMADEMEEMFEADMADEGPDDDL